MADDVVELESPVGAGGGEGGDIDGGDDLLRPGRPVLGTQRSLDPDAMRRTGDVSLFNRRSVRLRYNIAQVAQKEHGWKTGQKSTAKVGRSSTLGGQRRSRMVDQSVTFLTESAALALHFQSLHVRRNLSFLKRMLSAVPFVNRYISQKTALLNGISGCVKPGQMCAIIGPSGAGKTTLIDALAGRSAHTVHGDVFVTDEQGESISVFSRSKLARKFGPGVFSYVYQNDALFPNLTVRESLRYAAWFRLPSSTPWREKNRRVEQVIQILGLEDVANSKIGSQEHPVLSGGEMRRVSMGHELVTNPGVLFFDEPTSGLDSASAQSIVEMCSAMARAGNRTICVVIHQPTETMLQHFDMVVILSKGNVVYRGSPDLLPDYLGHVTPSQSIGHSIPKGTNPMEFTLELVKFYEKNEDGSDILKRKFESYLASGHEEERAAPPDSDSGTFVSSLAQYCIAPLQWCGFTKGSQYATTVFEQFLIMCHRNILNNFRTREVLYVRMGVMIALSLCVGSLFVLRDECEVRDVATLLLLGVASVVFNSIESLPVYCRERLIFIREQLSNSYHPLVYSLSHFLIHIPFLGVLAIIYSAGSYWLAGLTIGAVPYIYYNLAIWASLATGQALVIMTSTATADVQIGNAVVTAFFALMFYFGGFFLRRTEMPSYWVWFHYLSIFKYPFEGLLLSNYSHSFTCKCPCPTTIFDSALMTSSVVQGNCKYGPDTIINEFDIEITSPWVHLLILCCFCVFFRVMSYVFLQWTANRVTV